MISYPGAYDSDSGDLCIKGDPLSFDFPAYLARYLDSILKVSLFNEETYVIYSAPSCCSGLSHLRPYAVRSEAVERRAATPGMSVLPTGPPSPLLVLLQLLLSDLQLQDYSSPKYPPLL